MSSVGSDRGSSLESKDFKEAGMNDRVQKESPKRYSCCQCQCSTDSEFGCYRHSRHTYHVFRDTERSGEIYNPLNDPDVLAYA